MNKEIIKILKDSLDYEFDLSFSDRKQLLSYIEQLEKDKQILIRNNNIGNERLKELQKKAELGSHYKHLYSSVKKQKDDAIEYIKENKANFTCMKTTYLKCMNELLRMLGEIDVED